jgi:hexosaminidase
MATNVRLSDAPIFRHRGLMLDTARNFLPLYAMKRTLDAMAASKLNVLHWHATDSQSFPLVSPRVPQLARWVQSESTGIRRRVADMQWVEAKE